MMIGSYIKQSAIKTLAGSLSSAKTFAIIQSLVKEINDQNIPGAEKKQFILDNLKTMSMDIATWLINLLIELAVAYLKLQVK